MTVIAVNSFHNENSPRDGIAGSFLDLADFHERIFAVLKRQRFGIAYRHDVTTGADGTVTLRVAPGSYRIIEKSVPERMPFTSNTVPGMTFPVCSSFLRMVRVGSCGAGQQHPYPRHYVHH